MKRYAAVLLLSLIGIVARAQCLVSSLKINTGYQPYTGLAVPGGANGATPVVDPFWKVTSYTPDVASAVAATPVPGLVMVAPGNNADVVMTTGGWASNPPGNPGGWISCVNSNYYNTAGTGILSYSMTLERSFSMCFGDSIKLNWYIANDNYISWTDIDGVPLGFSQPASASALFFSSFTLFTQTVFLGAGTHTIHVVVHDFDVGTSGANPTGLNIYGTVSSVTGMGSLVKESVSCATYSCAIICDSTEVEDTVHLCAGASDTIEAAILGPDSVLDIRWSPATGLSDTTVLQPVVSASVSGMYHLKVHSVLPWNLAVNGDFEAGNTGFTSSYTYSPPPSTVLWEGNYSVYNNPIGVHSGFSSFPDHTSGMGKMLILNGASTASDVWSQTISVTPYTDYAFSAWFANCSSVTSGSTVPVLQFKINGILINAPTPLSTPSGTWNHFYTLWNSGSATIANISIYDANTTAGGNDFVIDDISFRQLCTAEDSVYVQVTPRDTTFGHTDTAICTSTGTCDLYAPAGYSAWHWNTGGVTPSITANASGTYWVATQGAGCHHRVDTTHLLMKHIPVVNLGPDQSVCVGTPAVLTAPPGGGATYWWSNGATTSSISVTAAGTYWLKVDSNGCYGTDTALVIVNPIPVVNLGLDTAVCAGDIVTLQSSGSYLLPVYSWSTGEATNTIDVTVSGTYWLRVNDHGCIATDTIAVNFKPLPIADIGNDTMLCAGTQLTLGGSTIAGYSYLWNIGSTDPSISVTAAGTYELVTTLDGCTASDRVTITQMDVPPSIFLGKDTVLCQNEKLQLHVNEPTVVWNGAIRSQDITITVPGIYWASVTNACGTTVDSINVIFDNCNIVFPTAFTPNWDSKNDIIRAIGTLHFFRDYRLSIYNRFGQRVFYTEDIYAGWDGSFNAIPQDVGTYFYMVTYTLHGKEYLMKGDFQLVR